MSSLAAFIQELLNDPNYGKADFAESLERRIKTLNRAQLQGFYKHLIKMSEQANSNIWKEANNELISHVEKFVIADKLLADEEKRIEDEITAKQEKKRQYEEGRVREGKRMRAHVKSKARKTAEEEVFERERKREAAEKVDIMEKEPAAAKRRLIYSLLGVFLLLVMIIITAVAANKQPIAIAVVVVVAILLSVFLFYKAYKVGQIAPVIVTKQELDEQIELRAEELTASIMADLAEKDRQFQEMDMADKEERRQRREERRRLRQEALASFEDLDDDNDTVALQVLPESEKTSTIQNSGLLVSAYQLSCSGLLSFRPALPPGGDLNLYVGLSSSSAGGPSVRSDTQWKVEQDAAVWRSSEDTPLLSLTLSDADEEFIVSLSCSSMPSPRSERQSGQAHTRSDSLLVGSVPVSVKSLLSGSGDEPISLTLQLQRNNVEVPVSVAVVFRHENSKHSGTVFAL